MRCARFRKSSTSADPTTSLVVRSSRTRRSIHSLPNRSICAVWALPRRSAWSTGIVWPRRAPTVSCSMPTISPVSPWSGSRSSPMAARPFMAPTRSAAWSTILPASRKTRSRRSFALVWRIRCRNISGRSRRAANGIPVASSWPMNTRSVPRWRRMTVPNCSTAIFHPMVGAPIRSFPARPTSSSRPTVLPMAFRPGPRAGSR